MRGSKPQGKGAKIIRKTPAIAVQVIRPFLQSNARFQARLIDFDTGSAALTDQHREFLRHSALLAKENSMYRIRLVGYASKLDDAGKNSTLSYARIDTALRFLQTVDQHAMDRTETFRAVGEDGYLAPGNDNSPEYRAVEAHIFIGDIPPPPSTYVPIPMKLPELPGQRFTAWEVGSPGGVFVAAGVGGGFNIFIIKNTKTTELRAYIQPVGGWGASLNLPGLDILGKIIKEILGGLQYGETTLTKVTSAIPVTWDELGGSLVRVIGLGLGAGRGYAWAITTFTAGTVYKRNENGYPIRGAGGDLFQFKSKGKDWQLGLGGSVALGPLKRVDVF